MINTFCKFPLWECTRKLSAVALGREKADLVIKNAKLINVCTHEILEGYDVAVSMGRIAAIGDVSASVGENTKVVDGTGKYLAPAFMDGHMHIESSMLTAGEYARAVIPHGTSGIFFDPHEICNVKGLDGVKCMLKDAETTPLKAMLTTPSCVPAVPGYGTFFDSGNGRDDERVYRRGNFLLPRIHDGAVRAGKDAQRHVRAASRRICLARSGRSGQGGNET